MAKHYLWWPYVRYLVRQYPNWEKTAQENLNLSERDAEGFNAVKNAIKLTERMNNGSSRLKVIQALHWDRALTLEGAALSIPCDKSTAARWQKSFFEEVARKAGYL